MQAPNAVGASKRTVRTGAAQASCRNEAAQTLRSATDVTKIFRARHKARLVSGPAIALALRCLGGDAKNILWGLKQENEAMGRDGRNYSAFVIGPNGARLTRADLPPPNLKRWVSRRKAEVVLAVEGGLITMTEACERYRLTLEEYLGWERGLTLFGVEGLKVGQSQQHRQTTRH